MASFYDFVIPMYVRGLTNMLHILQKGETFTKEKGISEEEVMGWKLVDDMLPLTFQIQTVCNNAKFLVHRITGQEFPADDDKEKTFKELYARLNQAIEQVKSADKSKFDGQEEKEVVLKMRAGERKFKGLDYAQSYALPNFYFHVTTLYNIFRARGAPVGKMDFLKGPDNSL